ncbi:hypothetical protein Q4520_16425 [Alteromonas sp. 1_MG-2023]|uniref:hypothetical protein n=1 Tax=Alteromonas sp. 1_MG-2023 TaxID=3062669 RepID=UPI0026E31736|nr:hypothetical protein [Alteromonas sp. 1_MG-2023]MDO6477011.1 hypothetical protein [Alteromonas sp. 1_MG-2023]
MRAFNYSLLAVFTAFSFGCSNTYFKKDVQLLDVQTTPPFDILEISESTNPSLDEEAFEISDKSVYKFTYLIQDTMRKRVVHGRKWQQGLSAIQVIFAAFASTFDRLTPEDAQLYVSVMDTFKVMRSSLVERNLDPEDPVKASRKYTLFRSNLNKVDKARDSINQYSKLITISSLSQLLKVTTNKT